MEEDIEDFSTEEIISELIDRIRAKDIDKWDKDRIMTLLGVANPIYIESLEDELKTELMGQAMIKYSLSELEERLK